MLGTLTPEYIQFKYGMLIVLTEGATLLTSGGAACLNSCSVAQIQSQGCVLHFVLESKG